MNNILAILQLMASLLRGLGLRDKPDMFIFLKPTPYTECPTDMLTTSNSFFFYFQNHICMSKTKTCFGILVKKSFRWHLEN